MNTSTPVLVLSAKTHGSLGILRTLGRLGVPCFAADSDPRGPASYSRYCQKRFLWNFEGVPREQALESLLDIGRQIGCRSLMIPTWDDTAVFAAEHYERLKEWFVVPRQSAELARSLVSKKEMFFLARKHGVPTPDTLFPTSVDQVEAFGRTATFPVMLKGIDGLLLKARTGVKMAVVNSARELIDLYRRLEDPANPNLMLQEFIPGRDDSQWMFNGYFDENSDCLIGFTGKKLREYPIHTGPTSLGICLKNDVVDTTTRRWMKDLGYRGVLDIGYRYDARDGQYKVLDANPRVGATFRLFVAANGMDVVRSLYLDMTGQPVPECKQPEGRKWLVEKDFRAFLDYRRAGELSFAPWLASLKGVEESGYFAFDDPVPFFRMCAHFISADGDR